MAAVLALVLGATLSGAGSEPDDALARLLVGQLGFTDAQVASVRRGAVVTSDVSSSVPREIAVAGAMRVAAPAARMADVIRDVERLERGGGFLATRRFSNPPTTDDMAELRLPNEDVADLRACRPGRCDVKLGRDGFTALAQVDWRRADAADQVNAVVRRLAVRYLEQYRAGGNPSLPVYLDTSRPLVVAAEFEDMVTRSAPLRSAFADVSAFLLSYPHGRPEGVDDFFYWSLARFGLKPVLRLNHVVVHPTGRSTGLQYVVTTKQLYASHYFQAALEVRALIDDPERPGRGHYLVVLNVARPDGLTGLFGGIVKLKVRQGARSGLQTVLRGMQMRAEGR